ncbi:glycoside hydrolase [Solirubrobacter ginsenosidimutans]|uniref:Glycoside hydrolase n=1 Tax=Solirubrobacter ginsenosidimutans TaxID=490573 RepID=A0A9X3MY43_9ACTN|nr:sialidase family protein [Solirubrobacter ginsenosidimutans]MDA0163460.1 glycoside hydrolase [Solirubrobacter ginsenosidimutans]
MPASPARAPRGLVWRLAAGVSTSALVALTLTPSAPAADRELTVSAAATAAWQGRAALASALFDPATLAPCGATDADVCDTTLVHVDGSGTLSLRTASVDAGTPDVDLYVYRSDAFGVAGQLAAVSTGVGADETVDLPAATGSYLVAAVSFATGASGFAGTATLAPRAGVVPDVDRPRGSQESVVSETNAGAASQPAVALRGETVVAAYRVFGDPAVYSSRVATAVSFDRGERWQRLGALSTGANPSLAFSRRDALLVTDEAAAVVLRRWARPTAQDAARGRTWAPPVALSAPPPGSVDERPVLAATGRRVIACWVRTADLGAYTRQAVLCRRSDDRGVTWDEAQPVTPATAPGVPYGPYVGGVAVAARRGVFSVAWVDTLAGTLDGSGLDAAWVASGAQPPVRVARFKPLPEHFRGDGFRNVELLSLANGGSGLYLAYAADVGGQADIQLVRSSAGDWGEPVSVGAEPGGADQFQPSVAVDGRRVHVFFLDRRLDPSGTFADEWLASSDDGGDTWEQRRLSHDSWDPAIGAPRSPTGDLLGDHQALAADRCGPIVLAADSHRANSPLRDRDFDKGRRVSPLPQLFAWALDDRWCA